MRLEHEAHAPADRHFGRLPAEFEAVRKELSERDPENTLLSRQSRLRLPAELVRDAALSASGLLSTAIGGPSVSPPQPAGVAELRYGNGEVGGEHGGGQVSPRPVHSVPAHGALSAADELRRAGFECGLHAAIALQYAAAGVEPVERSRVLRIRAGARGADSPKRSQFADRSSVSGLPGARPECDRARADRQVP